MSPRLIRRKTTALPLATYPPAFVVEAGGFIHVLASDESRRGAAHVALDSDGNAAWPPNVLRLSVLSASACGGQVVATGLHESDGVPWAMGLGARGEIRWETPLPASGSVRTTPACIAGEPLIVWEVERDAAAELGIAPVRGGNLGTAATFSQQGVAYGLRVATIGDSIFVLRGHGMESQADILRIEGGIVVARAETLKNAQALASVGERLVVLSWTLEALLLQWLDASLSTLGGPETIASVEQPSSSWIRFATLHAADDDRIAVSYLVGSAGGLVEMPGGRSEPGEYARHFLGCYDAASHALAGVEEVTPTGTAWLAGDWLGDRLFFAHGTTSASLSIFELDRAAR